MNHRLHPRRIRLAAQVNPNLSGPQPRDVLEGAISDPFNQSHVPSPRAAGIAYPVPIDRGTLSPMRREGPDQPFDKRELQGQVAVPSQIERYPIILGRNMTLEALSSRMRLSLTGYRQLYVDALDELIERDPHCYAVVAKRATTVANAKYKLVAPELPDETKTGKPKVKMSAYRVGAQSSRQQRADQIADECQQDFERIPRLKQHLTALAWADFYALSGTEIIWNPDRLSKRWRPTDMVFLHSRRFAFPDPWNWDLYVWDQGAVIGSPFGDVRLPPGVFGWRTADYPGKFVVHSPQIRADYPTREGLGRELAYWMVLKHIAMRAAPEYLERFSNPPLDISYSTAKEDGFHRVASDRDIADGATAALAGSLRAFFHPDSLKLDILAPDGAGGRSKVTFTEWAKYCDDQMTKAVLGSTLGTDAASSGSRALGDVQRKDTLAIMQFSAECLADSLDENLVRTWCRLNYPGDEELWPHIQASLEDDPDPMQIVERAVALAAGGVAVDGDEIAKMVGIPVVEKDDEEGRVMRPVKADLPTALPLAPMAGGNTPEAAEERAQQEAEAQQAQQEIARQHSQEDGAVSHERNLELLKVKGGAPAPAPGAPGAKKPEPAAAKPPPKPAPKVAAHDEAPPPPAPPPPRVLTFVERQVMFTKTVRELKELGYEPDVDRLAKEFDVPALKPRKS